MTELSRRQQLQADYRQQTDRAGIFRVFDTLHRRSYLGASADVAAALNRLQFELRLGKHKRADLLSIWRQHGPAGLEFSVLERIPLRDTPGWDLQQELALALQLWQAELQQIGPCDLL